MEIAFVIVWLYSLHMTSEVVIQPSNFKKAEAIRIETKNGKVKSIAIGGRKI